MSPSIRPCRELPDRRTFELLPGASDLGLMICSVEGRVVVSKVKAYSIAGEDGKIERGDVIDELGRQVYLLTYILSGWSGCRAGNREKVSNSHVC